MKKKILLIGTGGTIASEMTAEGLEPDLDTAKLLRMAPSAAADCDVDTVQLFSLDSTNLTPRHWLLIAKTIREHYAAYDGFVITHGTDTMAYTAAGLSYLIQGARKPIVLTGAQRPIGHESTDSRLNLGDAFHSACSETVHGVVIVFGGRVILGTRARKVRTKSFTAFSSINYPTIAVVQDGRLTCYIEPDFLPQPLFYDALEASVVLVKLIPGLDPEILRLILSRCDALIVESYGAGGLPEGECRDAILEAADRGKVIVMTTQVPNEGSDLGIYTVARGLKDHPHILEACDMTTEAALAKILWILAQTCDPKQIGRLFYTPVNKDILIRKS